jgi:hypothetical protein
MCKITFTELNKEIEKELSKGCKKNINKLASLFEKAKLFTEKIY